MAPTSTADLGSRLLVVEDDESQLQAISTFLQREGFQVIGCPTGAAALERLAAGGIGVAVVDLHLPDMTATEMLKRLRASDTNLEVVIHTAHSSYESAREAVNLGAFAYLEKTGNPAELVRHVHRAFKSRVEKRAQTLEDSVLARTRDLQGAFEQLQQQVAHRKLSDEALRQSEEEYRRLFENAEVLVSVYDASGVCVLMNKLVAEHFGGRPADFIGKSFEQLHPEQAEKYTARVREVIETATSREFEDTVRFPQGSRCLLSKVQPVRNPDGKVVAAQIISQDITERRRAEGALRESENRYRAVSELTSDFAYSFRIELDGTLVNEWVTGALSRVTGYTREELQSLGGWERLLHPDDRIIALDQLQTLLSNRTKTVEYRVLTRDGQTRWVRDYARPIWDATENCVTGIEGAVQDISERKRDEEALRESQQRFRTLADMLPQTVFECDVNGNLTFVNHCAYRVFGYEPEDFERGVNAIEMLAPADHARAMQNIAAALTGKTEPTGGEYLARRKDGGTFPVVIYSSPIVRNQQIVGLRGIIVDISERMQAEAALRESERDLREAQQTARIGSWVWDLTTDNVRMSVEMSRLFGLEEGTTTLKDAMQRIHCEDVEHVRTSIAEAVSGDAPYEAVFRVVLPDSQQRVIQGLGTVERDAKGKPLIMRGTSQDVTKQWKTDHALRESEERYRAIAEDMPVLICRFLEDGEITYVNQAYCRFFEKTADQLVGQSFLSLIPEADRETVMASIAELTADFPTQSHEHRVVAPDGRIRWHRWTNRALFDTGGKVTGYQSIGEDITERKDAENRVRQRETDIAHLHRVHTIGEMAAALAHELSQPLYAINNYVSGVRRQLQKDEGQGVQLREVSQAMGHAAEEVKRATRIVNHLREFVRKRGPLFSDVDINDLLESTVHLMEPHARQVGTEVSLNSVGNLPRVKADRVQIEQVIVNLMTNALDALSHVPKNRRKLEIKAVLKEEEGVEIAVCDLADGIPTRLAENVFEPYVTDKDDGLGMGLAICRSIIVAHNGQIWTEPNLPHGTTFRFTIPCSSGSP